MNITFFPASALGYVDYPEGLFTRGLAAGLLALGHDVRIVEERKNAVMTRTLKADGAAAARRLYEEFPELLVHSYEPRTGGRLLEWLSRELSLIDVAVAVDGLPDEVARWIANLTHPTLTRLYLTFKPQLLDAETVARLELDKYDRILGTGEPAAPIDWSPILPTLARQDRAADLERHVPPDLTDRLADPLAAAEAFEQIVRSLKD